MKMQLVVLVMAMSMELNAQTNVLQAQYSSVCKAIPTVFVVKKDPVTGFQNISTLRDIYCKAYFRVAIMAVRGYETNIPKSITITFIGIGTKFDVPEMPDSCELSIRADECLYNFGSVGKNRDSNLYLRPEERFSITISLEQLKVIAWSKTVYTKISETEFEIPFAERQPLKLLWNYYDLLGKVALNH